jgi:hypothetical protein
MSRVARWPIVLSLVLGAAAATPAVLPRRPILLRIEGHVGAPRQGDRTLASLNLRRGNAKIPLTITEIWVLSGDAAGIDVLNEVEQYDPAMSVDGPKEVLVRLAAAKPEEPLELIGYFRSGQRILMLSSVGPPKEKK